MAGARPRGRAARFSFNKQKRNLMAQIKIKQIKSRIGAPAVQKRTLDALGLRKMNHTVVKEDNPSVMGMVNRVRHLVEVTNA